MISSRSATASAGRAHVFGQELEQRLDGVDERVRGISHLVRQAGAHGADRGELLALVEAQCHASAIELGAYACDELGRLERLGHVVDRAGFEAAQAALERDGRREQQHRRQAIAGPVAEATSQLEAVHAGKADVADEHVGRVGIGERKRVLGVGRGLHVVVGRRESRR